MDEVIINGEKYVKVEEPSDLVVVRTYSAGVHIGQLKSRDGREVVLTNAKRLWRWRGANTLNEVAAKGVDLTSYTRISEPVSEITLTEAIEIIPVSVGVSFPPTWNV